MLVVDDGLATGSTVRAAVAALRQAGPARVVVGVPVGPRRTCERLREVADDVVCVSVPTDFVSVGQAYLDFDQVDERDVLAALARYRRDRA